MNKPKVDRERKRELETDSKVNQMPRANPSQSVVITARDWAAESRSGTLLSREKE